MQVLESAPPLYAIQRINPNIPMSKHLKSSHFNLFLAKSVATSVFSLTLHAQVSLGAKVQPTYWFNGAESQFRSIWSIARVHSFVQATESCCISAGVGLRPPHMDGCAASCRACVVTRFLQKGLSASNFSTAAYHSSASCQAREIPRHGVNVALQTPW